MAFHQVVHEIIPVPGVSCFCTTILLLICFLLSQPKPYSCYTYTSDHSINQVSGDLFLTDSSTRTKWDKVPSGGLGSYMKAYYPAFNLSDNGWFTFNNDVPRLDKASFNISFVVSVYQPNNQVKAHSGSLVFAIQPRIWHPTHFGGFSFMYYIPPYDPLMSPPSSTPIEVAGRHIFAQISTAYGKTLSGYNRISGVASGISGYDSFTNIVLMQIDIEPLLDNYSSMASNDDYTVWIDYNQDAHYMSVYVGGGEGALKPVNAITHATLNIEDITGPYVSFAFFSSIRQILQIHTVNSTWVMAPNPSAETPSSEPPRRSSDSHGKRAVIAIVFYSILALVAAAMPAAGVYFYLNSEYRMWKKEQDKLSRAMQRLPGVPIRVDYDDIRRATNNFDARMKLGQGGFGAVYQCTLPATATRTERPMKVAIKKFTQQVEHQRYNDFLNEVSIINRLRHKNIVPLLGWSYDRGVPLLIFEFMTKGSLDQHLFRRCSTSQHDQPAEDNCIWQWHVRYGIARDIATGLNYVHHEHEPVVLHRDIKASNIMLDSNFNARLGDFGIACTVSVNRGSVSGIVGTFGYIAPDYAMSHEATPKTDVYAFGVLVLEIVAGKKNGDVGSDDIHITDWVWRLHQQGMLLEAVDSVLSASGDHDDQQEDEAKRLLLIGLACTNPNPSDRPTMGEVLQVLTKGAPVPDVPLERPTFVWPPADWRSRNSVYSTAASSNDRDDTSSANTIELGQVRHEQPSSGIAGGHVSVCSRDYSGETSYCGTGLSGEDTVACPCQALLLDC
ncbi:hypothetical protein U9M48_000821 [Paspalum notatum var. saurae]|uniref:Protein kinase domain-containing protein n=1 Tax=Paspalum notatum var. saurae TaxID=547442 RepID=A0AAQ3PMC3_PASNO